MPQHRGDMVDYLKWHQVSRAHFARVAPQYDAGRAFEQGEFWAREIASQIAVSENDWVLDAGCGTGIFARAFARTLRCKAVGLDLSSAMLGEAQSQCDDHVCWMQGRSEHVGLRAATLQAIFLSQVWHHLEDDAQAAREFQRLLKRGGGLFIKTYSHAQLRERWDLNVAFPELMPFMLDIYPDTPELMKTLRDAGFRRVWHKAYRQDELLQPSVLLDIAEKKLWSMFAYLDDAAHARGIAFLHQLVAETHDAPIPSAQVHLLVGAEK